MKGMFKDDIGFGGHKVGLKSLLDLVSPVSSPCK